MTDYKAKYEQLRAATMRLVSAVGALPENAHGYIQGQDLNEAYALCKNLTENVTIDPVEPTSLPARRPRPDAYERPVVRVPKDEYQALWVSLPAVERWGHAEAASRGEDVIWDFGRDCWVAIQE